MTNNFLKNNQEEIINIESEDKKILIFIILTVHGTIFQINKMESTPTILLLTLKRTIDKLKKLKIESVNNLISKIELDMFNNKKIVKNMGDKLLIEIKTDDLLKELINVFGINTLELT